MKLDIMFLTSIVTQVLLAVCAVYISFWDGWSKQHRCFVLIAFGVLAVVSVVTTYCAGANAAAETARAQAETQKSLEALSTKTDELGRTSSLNMELQHKLLSQSDALIGLSKQNLNEQTGGTSFCYVFIDVGGPGASNVTLITQGSNSLRNVFLKLIDLDAMKEAMKKPPYSLDSFTRTYGPIPVLQRSTAQKIDALVIAPEQTDRAWNAFLMAENGQMTELIRFHRNPNGTWETAYLVSASYHSGQKGIVFERISKDFPHGILQNDSDWTEVHKLAFLKVD
jgi:hypothetical protein